MNAGVAAVDFPSFRRHDLLPSIVNPSSGLTLSTAT